MCAMLHISSLEIIYIMQAVPVRGVVSVLVIVYKHCSNKLFGVKGDELLLISYVHRLR